MSYLLKLVDTVLPPRCPFTGEVVDSQGMISPLAWGNLSFIAAPYCKTCGFPFEFTSTQDALCAAYLADPPEFSAARAALVYNDVSRDFILGFKHGDQTQSVVTMVPWMKVAGADILSSADVIVPVPLHRWRLLRRRYNQAALIGRALAKEMKIAFSADALTRIRATETQGHLNAGERKKNVKSAFEVHPKRAAIIADKKIVLVDDVYTTGATVSECTKALLKAGAADVSILTLARVVRPTRV